MSYNYSFPVVKGVQAGREYFIAMVPIKMLKVLFPNDEEYVEPEFRAQRRLNETRIPEIRRYILSNRDNYVFSALAASIDGHFSFVEFDREGVGILNIPMDAKFLINDGQHRKAALLSALEEDPSIGEETISVVFYEDKGLNKSQQMFTDLNKHAVKTSNSISELYDSRDLLAVATRSAIAAIPFLDDYVDKEKDNLGKYSSSLFTLNAFYRANRRILGRRGISDDFEAFLIDYWRTVTDNMVPWQELISKELSKVDLREKYIATQAVVIQALGRLGAYFYENRGCSIEEKLIELRNINWRRTNKSWKLRVIKHNGRMITNEKATILACNVIKKSLMIEFTPEEEQAEKEYLAITDNLEGKDEQ